MAMSPRHQHAEDREGTEYGGEAPALKVVVYRRGDVIHRELCESADAAAEIVERWSEIDGVECTVDGISVEHRAGQILEAAPEEAVEETYPHTTRSEPRD
jgi:hypothetical protein